MKRGHMTTDYSNLPSDAELLANPCVSYWLKNAIRDASNRDVVDAANDAELLYAVLIRRVDTALASLGCAHKPERSKP